MGKRECIIFFLLYCLKFSIKKILQVIKKEKSSHYIIEPGLENTGQGQDTSNHQNF